MTYPAIPSELVDDSVDCFSNFSWHILGRQSIYYHMYVNQERPYLTLRLSIMNDPQFVTDSLNFGRDGPSHNIGYVRHSDSDVLIC